jgi:hypothetical protein
MGVLVFSWGITSNLVGEWWASALLLTLAAGWQRLRRPAVAALAVVVATLALLAHPGILLLTGTWLAVLVGGLTVGWLMQRGRGDTETAGRGRSLAALLAVVALATTLAFALFYRVDAAMMLEQGSTTLAQRLSGETPASDQPRRWRVSGSVDDRTLGLQARYVTELARVPLAGLAGYAREAWAYYWGWPFLAAGLGWWTLGVSPASRRLRWLSLAWLATAGLFALAGLFLNLYVRYMLFLLPVICVLAGVGLDWLARRGRAGAAVTVVLLVATVLAGLWLWYQRIVFFFH